LQQSIFTPKRTRSLRPVERVTPRAIRAANETLRSAYAALDSDPTLLNLRTTLGAMTYHWSLFCETCCASGTVMGTDQCPHCHGAGLVAYVPEVPTHDSVSPGSVPGQGAAAAFAALSQD
jgi:hypothetical protein